MMFSYSFAVVIISRFASTRWWCCCVVVWAEAISIQTKTPSSTLFDGSWASTAHFNIHKQHNNTKKTSEVPFITLCAEASLSTWLEAARSSCGRMGWTIMAPSNSSFSCKALVESVPFSFQQLALSENEFIAVSETQTENTLSSILFFSGRRANRLLSQLFCHRRSVDKSRSEINCL